MANHYGKRLMDEWRASDEFFDISYWPNHFRAKFFNPHKQRADRFSLWHFFYHNGMAADRATYWVMWHNTYDRSAWSSMKDLEERAEKAPSSFWKYQTFDMIEGRVV